MKLSVIITSYKFKDFISQCIDSILSQKTDFGFEVLIRDDGTNDGTFELIHEKYKTNTNVRILDSSTNVGAVENLLILVNEAKGKYIAHIDGDDYLTDDGYYQRSINYLDENPSYALYCSGCRYLENGVVSPENHWIVSAKPDIELKDLLVENYVSFARVFKKAEFRREIFKEIIYPDWVFNFEILKYGKGYCDTNHCAGIYRIHKNGMFSMTPAEEKLENKNIIKSELKKRYARFQHKVITIVDSFVYNDSIRSKLLNTINWMKEDGHEVLLVSNTMVDKEILKYVKFYLYDSRNQLFQEKYEDVGLVDFWKCFVDGFYIHDVVPVLQKHGLSVMINLFNALLYAKSQGYTHFQRFEVDDVFGEKSREYIKRVPYLCANENKHGLFYYNEGNNPPDMSFHYFYCNIDEFLSKVPRLSNEQDYVNYLRQYHDDKKFRIVEVYVHESLKRNNDSEFLIKFDENAMILDFPDTRWNTETSISSFDPKYGKCTTRLYYINEHNKETNTFNRGSSYIVYTHSYHSGSTLRKIVVEKIDGEKYEFIHKTEMANGCGWNEVFSDVKSISVYEDNKFLYREHAADCISYINLIRK